MNRSKWLALIILLSCPTVLAQQVQVLAAEGFRETGQLSDPVLEQRAVALGRTLRCVVCANQSIEDSDVELAQTLRQRVRDRLLVGADEQQIRQELVRSYGQYVTYTPATDGLGWLLWVSPWALLTLGGGAVILGVRRRNANG